MDAWGCGKKFSSALPSVMPSTNQFCRAKIQEFPINNLLNNKHRQWASRQRRPRHHLDLRIGQKAANNHKLKTANKIEGYPGKLGPLFQ